MRPICRILVAAATFASAATTARAADPLQYYPAAARKLNIEGFASIACYVRADGALRDCVVQSEDPPGNGFGEAALQMAPLFKMRPATSDGQPIESPTPIIIPIKFRLPVYGFEVARRLTKSVSDPRVKAWVSRIVAAGRTTTGNCRGLLKRDGFYTLLSPDALATDEDLSRGAAIAKLALQHVTNECAREEGVWRASALADLNSLGLRADQHQILVEEFERGLGRYREQVATARVAEVQQAADLMEFLRANGVKWRTSNPGFIFPNEAVATKGKEMAARADSARKALLNAESSAP